MIKSISEDCLYVICISNIYKVILKDSITERSFHSELSITEMEVYQGELIYINDNILNFDSNTKIFEENISCCKLRGNRLALAEGTIASLMEIENFETYAQVMDNTFPVTSIEFANNGE